MQVQHQRSRPIDLLVAVAIPLALLALAYALWAISDRLVHVGLINLAAFGFFIVLPVWLLAPGVAGLAWSRSPGTSRALAMVIVDGAVAAVSGLLLASSITFAHCAPVVTWVDNLFPSLMIGLVIGAGPAIGALAAASVADRLGGLKRVFAAVATGAVIGVVGFWAAIITFVAFFPALSCPPIPQ